MDTFSIYKHIYRRFCVQQTGFHEVSSGLRVPSPCWVWTGTVNGSGYAELSYAGTTCMPYRQMYGWYCRPIPDHQEVHHRCYNTRCIRPSHLQAVTRRENCALRQTFVACRNERLVRLGARHKSDLLFPGLVFESTYLASLWQCQSHNVPDLLETIAFLDARVHYEDIRRGKHGPQPSLFRLWFDPTLIEEFSIVIEPVLPMV
jgi:hypothetical protein